MIWSERLKSSFGVRPEVSRALLIMKRNIIITLLSLLLAVVTIASLLFTPSAAQNRLRPIPAHAQLVYNNQNPDWFLSFFPTLGSREPRQAQSFPSFGKMDGIFSKHWKKKFQGLEKFPLAVATVPFNGREGRDAWVAVSELGGPTALLFRWRLLLFPPEGVTPSRAYAVWPVWKLEHPALPAWAQVRFALTDGLLICSISDDSHDIYKLLDIFDGRAASLADRRKS